METRLVGVIAPRKMVAEMGVLRFLSLAIATLMTAAGPAVAALGICCCSSQRTTAEKAASCCGHGEDSPNLDPHQCCERHDESPQPASETCDDYVQVGCCCFREPPATVVHDPLRLLVESSGLDLPVAVLPASAPDANADDVEFVDPGLNFALHPPLNVLKCVWLE